MYYPARLNRYPTLQTPGFTTIVVVSLVIESPTVSGRQFIERIRAKVGA